MTFRTHKMIADAGETDTGQMTSQTSIAPATKMYLACDEGTGSMSDKNPDTGLVFANADPFGSVAWAGAANSCQFMYIQGSGEVAPATGTIPSVSGKSFLVWYHATPSILASTYAFKLGNYSGAQSAIRVQSTGSQLIDNSNNVLNLPNASVVLDDVQFTAIFFNNATKTVSFFESTDGVAVAWVSDTDASTLVDVIDFANEIQVGSAGPIDTYGIGLYGFTTPPSTADITANLEIIRQNQLTSNKALPVDWLMEL